MKRTFVKAGIGAVMASAMLFLGTSGAGAQETLTLLNTAVQFLSPSDVVIRWDTSIPSSSEVEYGLTPAYGKTSGRKMTMTASHTVMLGGLAPGVPYHFRVKSESVTGSTVASRDYTLTTKASEVSAGTVSSSPSQTGASGTLRVPKIFARDLTIGMRGDDVMDLQKFLIEQEHYPEALATGYFGPLTRAAVARFQQAQSIAPAAGYFGPLTRVRAAALEEEKSNSF